VGRAVRRLGGLIDERRLAPATSTIPAPVDTRPLSWHYRCDITMIAPRGNTDDALGPGAFSPRQVHEQQPAQAFACPPAIGVAVAAVGLAALLIALGVGDFGSDVRIAGGVVAVAVALVAPGLVVVQPNESRVLILFGRYVGTLTEARLWWVNPFTVRWRKQVSLRVRNFQSERIKVNDSSGNPIEIATVVVWRVVDTAKAVFDVEDFEQFVEVQSETALRHLANEYPYDDYSQNRISLRGNAEEVRHVLEAELQTRLQTAGIDVLETRLTHLAYAAEIAEVMLRRQQAEAILAARRTMVQGAVGLVQMALAQLADSDLVELDSERKATMVANLMVVLSGDHSPTPVINTGSLYT
jgi:regulator of protease activity HflC (stomatin/prohibitin superfamily)